MPIKWPYLLGLIFLLGVCFYLFYSKIENFFVFFPQSHLDQKPEDLHLKYKEVFFDTEDGRKLHGWLFPLPEKSPLILFFHGNAGNISHRLDNVRLLLNQGLSVFIFDYRGYGKSTGRPSEKGLYRDGIAAYDHLVREEHITSENIVLFGRSLGAAVAVDIALKREVKALILESAFTSTKDMAKTMFLFGLLAPVLPPNYNNLKKIVRIDVPKLIIHGTEDNIVPYSMGEKLFDASKAPKIFFPIEEAGHNDTYFVDQRKYFKTFATFAKDLRI
jgi:fermentation-respiration switch protein FrsA (DUF1100 family)